MSNAEYILTAIDFATGKALAYAFPRRGATAAIVLVDEIVWSCSEFWRSRTNGAEFRSNQYLCHECVTKHGFIEVPSFAVVL